QALIQMRDQDIELLRSIARESDASSLTDLIVGLAELSTSLRFSPDVRTSLEIGLIRLASMAGQAPVRETIRQPKPAKQEQQEQKKQEKKAVSPAVPSQEKPAPPVTLTESCDTPGSETIATKDGDELLLPVWRDILELLQKERRFDISLCARPARVLLTEGTFDIRFDNNLFGQYACLNKKESIDLIEQLLRQRTGQAYPVRISLDESLDESVGATAEWQWLKQAREQALTESIPEPLNGSDHP
ncbi:MAG: hypothetical protein GX809_00005, partial [Clostridiaceae bacterium]|nr:hypothetical protein [Clostridiaceae bacterium]